MHYLIGVLIMEVLINGCIHYLIGVLLNADITYWRYDLMEVFIDGFIT